MMTRSVIGQLDLFNVENYSDNVASNFDYGLSLSNVSTRTKVFISPHRKITRKVLDEAATKLASLEPLKRPEH